MYGADDRGYHAASPFVFGQALRRRALICLADMGIPVRYGHSEVGYIEARAHGGEIWEQHEIELDLLPLPDAADAVLLTQWVLRNLAHREGMRCSTEPMMSEAHAGNGLHVHFSPASARAPTWAGAATPRTPHATPPAGSWPGSSAAGDALMAFGNRVPSSFTRVRQGREAPHAIVWGEFDRSALVRLPMLATTEDGRAVAPPDIEFRLPDGSAHPHLVLAGVAQAMCEAAGEPRRISTPCSSARNARRGAGGRPVPHDFPAVADALERERAVLEAGGVFPPRCSTARPARPAPVVRSERPGRPADPGRARPAPRRVASVHAAGPRDPLLGAGGGAVPDLRRAPRLDRGRRPRRGDGALHLEGDPALGHRALDPRRARGDRHARSRRTPRWPGSATPR